MEPRLIQNQQQRMILSPQIRQYLKVLQMPLHELELAIGQALVENPVLEEKPQDISDLEDEAPQEKSDTRELSFDDSFASFDKLDESYFENYDPKDLSRPDPAEAEEKRRFQESLTTKSTPSLMDYLTWQLGLLNLSDTEKRAAEYIVGSIEEDGYLRTPVEEIASSLQIPFSEIESALKKIQSLDPPGIGARNVAEALEIQWVKKYAPRPEETLPLPQALYELGLIMIREHLPLLEKRDWAALGKLMDAEKAKQAAGLISKLDPKPGRGFLQGQSLAVIPDAAIMPDDDEKSKYRVEIFHERIPEIRISPYYRRMLRSKELDEAGRNFIKEKIQAGIQFIQALQLRGSTLRNITEEIAKQQQEFLEKGFLHLKPLRLKDIANFLGIHESTVSRAIQEKYVMTPQGTIPYKSFFSTRMETTEGPAESQKSIMEKIRFLIQAEDPENPLSDQDLVKRLAQDGIKVARRTVAKYRELQKIFPSHLRRRK